MQKRLLFFWTLIAAANIISLFLSITKIGFVPKPGLLHYTVFYGVDASGDLRKVYLLPLSATIITILNYLGYKYSLRNNWTSLGEVFTGITLFVQFSTLFALYFIFKIN